MDLDDLLSEILLRLPPLPSSLPRASLVCARWRRLVTDPSFIRRFRAHHWRPLGVFFGSGEDLSFSFISDPRYPILPERFSVRVLRDVFERYTWELHGCRHGRVVLAHRGRSGHVICQFLVWNPLTGEAHFLDISQFLDPVRNQNGSYMKGAVIGASGDKGPFKFVLAWNEIHHRIAHICVYSSETGVWGDVISTAVEPLSSVGYGNVLVGHTLYWILFGHQVHILQFDLGSQNLAVIEGPPVEEDHWGIFLCTLGKGGGLSLIVMSANLKAQLWLWETSSDSDGVARWMHGGTIELDKLLSLRSGEYQQVLWLAGDDNVMFVSTNRGVFMVDLESMQFQKIFETSIVTNQCIHPFKNRYAQGNCIHLRCKYTKSFVLFPIIGLMNTASPFVFLNL
jgi:hypothetical protein